MITLYASASDFNDGGNIKSTRIVLNLFNQITQQNLFLVSFYKEIVSLFHINLLSIIKWKHIYSTQLTEILQILLTSNIRTAACCAPQL